MKRRVLIDGNGVAHWRHHASAKYPNARGAREWIEQFVGDAHADDAVVVFDGARCWRNEVLPSYKGHRPTTPPIIVQEIGSMHQQPVDGTRSLRVDGYEADDVIATLVARSRDTHVMVVSNDKDLLQLVSPTTVVFAAQQGRVFDRAAVAERWGVEPEHMRALLALMGDRSDGLDGVPGFGAVHASSAAREGWERIWARTPAEWRASGISPALQLVLQQFRPRAERNYQLVRLVDDVPLRGEA